MNDESKQEVLFRDSWTSSFTDPRGHKMTVEEFCRWMPKIELHAHLSGSVPDTVVQQLLEAPWSGSVGQGPSVVEPTSSSDSGTKTSNVRPPPQVGVGPSVVEPTSSSDSGTKTSDVRPPPQVGAGPSVVEPTSSSDSGTNTSDVRPPPQVGLGLSVVEPTSSSDSGTKTSNVRPPTQEGKNLPKASGKNLDYESQFTIEKKGKRRTMEECFNEFKALHNAISSLAALTIATRAVLDAFHQENVLYLELRSTPRAFAGSSKREYMDTLVQTVTSWQRERHSDMTVRLVVSLDRGRPLADAEENLQVALQMAKEQEESGGDGLLVGVDISGDPSKGDLEDLLPLMLRAKERGLGVLLHACEVLNDRCHSEALAVLRQVPVDRLGHCTYLHCDKLEQYSNNRTVNTENSDDGAPAAALDGGSCRDDIMALEQLVRQQKIPIEVCLSSNLCSGTCPAADQHHFRRWFLESGHPVCVCTDDRGVFQTSLSEEFAAVTQVFALTPRQLQKLVENAASASLLPALHKERLLNRVRAKFCNLKEQ